MPFSSEAQRRLMYAAAAGKDTKADISQAEAKRMVSHDEPGKLPEKVEKAGEGDGSDMAKQFLAEINELSGKINSMIDGKQELEDWVDGKITRAKTDLSDISGYLEHNKNILAKAKECCEMLSKKKQKAEKSIHGSQNTPDRVVNTVDGIAKADDEMSDYEKKAKGALDFRNQMKDFRRQHGSTIMDIAGGRKIPADRADAYHAARGQLVVGHGVGPQDIPPKIPGHLIDRPKVQAEEVKPLALPAAKSMEPLANPKSLLASPVKPESLLASPVKPESLLASPVKPESLLASPVKPESLLAKVDDFIKCMRKSKEENESKESESLLQKSSKKKKPFHGYNKKKHARSGGLNDSYRKKLNRETGSNLKRPVTKKNVKPGSKAAKRRKSFCARMSGVKGPTSKDGKLTPKGAALKRWRCSKSLNKSESVPLELRAYRVLEKLEKALPAILGTIARTAAINVGANAIGNMLSGGDDMDKSNNLKPFGTNVYDNTANLGRKMGRVSEVAENLGPNTAVQQRGNLLHGTMKDQTEREAKRMMELNRKQPVKSVDLSTIPADKKQEVTEAIMSGRSHPLLEQAKRVILTNKRKKAEAIEQETEKSLEKENKLVGGKGDESRRSDFSAKQLVDGMKVELEHTKDSKVAEEIALDHLTEDPHYYSKLKTSGLADELEKRCWEGYEPVPGKKPYSKGSCVKKAISAPAMESGEYKGETLDAHHHNRLGKEYREMARQAIAKNDKQSAAKYHIKSLFHFSKANEMGLSEKED